MPSSGGYRLLEGDGPASPHATAAVVVSFGTRRGLEFLAAGEWAGRVTPYFGYFVAKALAKSSPEAMRAFVRTHYLPWARRYGTLVERTDDAWSLAHGWSVGVAELILGGVDQLCSATMARTRR